MLESNNSILSKFRTLNKIDFYETTSFRKKINLKASLRQHFLRGSTTVSRGKRSLSVQMLPQSEVIKTV